MTRATLATSSQATDLTTLATCLRHLSRLHRSLKQLPLRHQSPGLEKDLNRLELRVLNLYQWISFEVHLRSNQSDNPFHELVLKDRSLR